MSYGRTLVTRAWSCLAILAAMAPAMRAHAVLSDYVWHRVALSANGRHVDVTVELTFFEDWSARERERMDENEDGQIQRGEREEYARGLAATREAQLTLQVGGQPVPLISLYDPVVDLLRRATVERGGHHVLTLRYFARLPEGVANGAEILLEDHLWPEARSLAEIQTSGNGPGAIERGEVAERGQPPPGKSGALRFTARYRIAAAPAMTAR